MEQQFTQGGLSKSMIRQAYSLIIQGKAPIEIRKIIGLTEKEWWRLSMSSYYHQLLKIGDAKSDPVSEGLKYIQSVELTIWRLLEERGRNIVNSPSYCKINQQINELSKVYSGFNIYNY